jgi:hypothetical protein
VKVREGREIKRVINRLRKRKRAEWTVRARLYNPSMR